MNIKDKIIVIAGASRGFGVELGRLFVEGGARVVLSSRSPLELKQAAQSIGAEAIEADVTDERAVVHLRDEVVKRFGRIDVWVNNAGVWLPHALVEDQDWGRVEEIMRVNLFGTVYGSKAALLQMRQQGGGMIVNINSSSGLVGRPGSSGYCATKFAADGFTKSLRMELQNDHIFVMTIYPGGMKTHLFDEAKPEAYENFMDPAEVARKVIDNILLDAPLEELVVRKP